MDTDDYVEMNRRRWDELVEHHYSSKFYDVPSFLNGKSTIPDLEMNLLGDVRGKRILHLQCHFGMDTLSLARAGAEVVGVDFSENAVRKARELQELIKIPEDQASFVKGDVTKLHEDEQLGEFDMVFTSHGTISWLPELVGWGRTVGKFLRPRGVFVMVDTHPLLGIFEPDEQELSARNTYFHSEIVYTYPSSYATDAGVEVENARACNWQHSLSDIFTALSSGGLVVTSFREYPFLAWQFFRSMEKGDDGYYHMKSEIQLPLMFSLEAKKLVPQS